MSKIDLDIIWDALHEYREEMSDQGATHFEDKWDDICYQMALIEEALQEGAFYDSNLHTRGNPRHRG